MDEQLNKSNIVSQMQIERRAFEATLGQVSESRMTTEAIIDAWTVKDILAHIIAWERELLEWLAIAAQGHRPDIPLPGTWAPYVQSFNDRAYADDRDRPLSEVLANFHQVYDQLLEELQQLPEDPNDSLWSVWLNAEPPWELIADFAEHYREHGQQIQDWLRRS